ALHAHQHHFRRRPVLSAEKNVARPKSRHARLAGNFKTRGVIGRRKTPGSETRARTRRRKPPRHRLPGEARGGFQPTPSTPSRIIFVSLWGRGPESDVF